MNTRVMHIPNKELQRLLEEVDATPGWLVSYRGKDRALIQGPTKEQFISFQCGTSWGGAHGQLMMQLGRIGWSGVELEIVTINNHDEVVGRTVVPANTTPLQLPPNPKGRWTAAEKEARAAAAAEPTEQEEATMSITSVDPTPSRTRTPRHVLSEGLLKTLFDLGVGVEIPSADWCELADVPADFNRVGLSPAMTRLWLDAGPDSPWLHVHRRKPEGSRGYVYWWAHELREPADRKNNLNMEEPTVPGPTLPTPPLKAVAPLPPQLNGGIATPKAPPTRPAAPRPVVAAVPRPIPAPLSPGDVLEVIGIVNGVTLVRHADTNELYQLASVVLA